MKVVIFGSTGGTGRKAIERALAEGHEVTAFARHPEKLGALRDKVRLVVGDVLDAAKVDEAVAGQDAVVSCLGTHTLKASDEISRGVHHVIEAMKRHGVKRIVLESARGTNDSFAAAPLPMRLAIRTLLRHPYQDKEPQEAELKASGLEAVIVRPGKLVNGPGGKEVRASPDGRGVKPRIDRADVAAFMVHALKDPSYVGRAPVIGY